MAVLKQGSNESRHLMLFLTYLSVILKAIIYGTSVYFTGTLTQTTDVLDILALRFLMSFVVLWLLKVTRLVKIRIGITDIFRKHERSSHMKTLLLAALFEPVLYMIFETLGISLSTNITTAIILALSPLSGCLFESLILKEKTSWLQKFFLVVGVCGVSYIAIHTGTADGKQDSFIGIVFLVMAVASGSLFAVFSRTSSKSFTPMERTYMTAALGMVSFNAVNIVRHLIAGDILHYFDPYFNVDNLIGFAFLAIVSTIIATGLNNFALTRAQVSTLAAFGGFSTLTTVILGVLTGEDLMSFHLVGLVLVLTGMIGTSTIEIRRERLKHQ